MTQSAFSAAADAIKALLMVAPVVSQNVTRGRRRDIPQAWADTVNIYVDGAKPEQRAIFGAPVDWTVTICVELYAKTTATGTSGEEVVDALMKSVYERIAADPTLGGKVRDVGDPDIETDGDDSAEKTGWVRLKYPVQIETANFLLELP